jgi:hypothetical protein
LTSFMSSRQSGKGAERARRATCGRDSVSQHAHLDLGQSVAPGRRDVRSSASLKAARFSSISLGSRPRLALRRRPVAWRREVRAKDELALKTARFETAMCSATSSKEIRSATRGRMARVANRPKQPLEVLPEPCRMSGPQYVDRVEAGTLAARQPPARPPSSRRRRASRHA